MVESGESDMSKQTNMMNHYFAGGSLTVDSCKRLYKTTELRRVNSRINHVLDIEGNKRIEGEFLSHVTPGGCIHTYDEFKTYRLVNVIRSSNSEKPN